jgi:hypothetical protein
MKYIIYGAIIWTLASVIVTLAYVAFRALFTESNEDEYDPDEDGVYLDGSDDGSGIDKESL